MRYALAVFARKWIVIAWVLMVVGAACGQSTKPPDTDLEDRPVSAIHLEGLQRVNQQLVRNQLRSAEGDPFDWDTVRADIRILNRLGEFGSVTADVELQSDGSVALFFKFIVMRSLNCRCLQFSNYQR